MIRFERTALYEEVWAAPLTRLGKNYGLSDNGLRKICKAINIQLPLGSTVTVRSARPTVAAG